MTTPMQLIRKLRVADNQRALMIIEELRVRGWLSDGSMRHKPICNCDLQHADLIGADLENVDLHQAHLQHAQLCQADLTGAKLTRAVLHNVDFSEAVLVNTDLFKADLQNARNLTHQQLSQAKRLWGAIMPDGTTYDGRYNLAGDLDFAKWGRVNLDDEQAMADFLRVPLETYRRGQEMQLEEAEGAPA